MYVRTRFDHHALPIGCSTPSVRRGLACLGISLLVALLPACGAAPRKSSKNAPAPPVVEAMLCDANLARFLLGQRVTSELVADARVRSGALYVRILDVGESVPIEGNPQRLNLLLDTEQRVKAVRCR